MASPSRVADRIHWHLIAGPENASLPMLTTVCICWSGSHAGIVGPRGTHRITAAVTRSLRNDVRYAIGDRWQGARAHPTFHRRSVSADRAGAAVPAGVDSLRLLRFEPGRGFTATRATRDVGFSLGPNE
jgi:hypothetical protein